MDPDKEKLIEIDLSKLTQATWAIDGHNDSYTINTTSPTYTWPNNSPSWTFTDLGLISSPPQAKIELRGEDADIEINGESVVSMLREIRDRLNILQVSEEMEQEWDELRELREQYEAKLTQCREKSAIWKTLKHEN